MQRRKIIEILIAILLILGLIALLWWLLTRENVDTDIVSDTKNDIEEIDETPSIKIDYTQYEVAPETIARVFAERFGSFSNEADFANITSLMDLCTTLMQEKLEGIMESSSINPQSEYHGISTNIISVTVVEKTDLTSIVEIQTQREESVGNPSDTTVRYQTMRVYLDKWGTDWLVNDFVWLD